MKGIKTIVALSLSIGLLAACEATTTIQFTSSSTPDVVGMQPSEKVMVAFVQQNRSQLAEEVAQGQGEHLATVAHVLGCEGLQEAQLRSALQKHYAEVFESTSDWQASQGLLAHRCL